MKMILKYSWLQYKRMMFANKLLFGHVIVFIPGLGFIIYYVKDDLFTTSEFWLSIILFFIFFFQTFLIVGKRLKNEDFCSFNSYNIFPQKKINIYFYTLVFGMMDVNVILLMLVSVGMILYVTNLSVHVIIAFLVIFSLCEITYLIFMMAMIEVLTEKYRNSKNLFLVSVLVPMLIQQLTSLAEKFYLYNYYPISGWIGSTINAALKGDTLLVLFYFCVAILSAIPGLFLLNKISFPRQNNAF